MRTNLARTQSCTCFLLTLGMAGLLPACTTSRSESVATTLSGHHVCQANRDKVAFPRDNDLCLICHLDFAYDSITEDHLAAGITCYRCHGLSTEHMSDETMMTSPDVLHGRTEVDSMCMVCHAGPHEENPESVKTFLTEWENKKRENGRSVTPESVCTDCHGLHTIARR